MLLLTKTVLSLMIGFLLATLFGLFLIPLLKKLNVKQRLSIYMEEAHRKKSGTPTMGGLIFLIPTFLTTVILTLMGKIEITTNLIIILFVLVGYAIIGFLDDYLIIKRHDNKGLTEIQKLFGQLVMAIIFFFIYMKTDGQTSLVISTLGINIELGWLYGVFILFALIAGSNAVNITDGLDGLCGGLSVMAFLSYGVIAWGSYWISGYQEIAIFCFVLVGAILGFLVFNTHPAKVFMGDTGSLALGGALATTAIITRHEISLAIIGGVFVIETLSSLIQIIAIRKFHKKVFKKAPLHHHFEQLDWSESDIVKMFWIAGFMLGMLGIIYGVWL